MHDFRNQLSVESLERRAMLTTLFVESGAVGGDGSAAAPFGTIQDAVEAAAALPGDDTVKIAGGVYEENIEIEDSDALTLHGNGQVTIKHPEVDLDAGEERKISSKRKETFHFTTLTSKVCS